MPEPGISNPSPAPHAPPDLPMFLTPVMGPHFHAPLPVVRTASYEPSALRQKPSLYESCASGDARNGMRHTVASITCLPGASLAR